MDCGEQDGGEGDSEDLWVGEFGFRGPPESVGPGDADLRDADGAGFGEAEADVIPIML